MHHALWSSAISLKTSQNIVIILFVDTINKIYIVFSLNTLYIIIIIATIKHINNADVNKQCYHSGFSEIPNIVHQKNPQVSVKNPKLIKNVWNNVIQFTASLKHLTLCTVKQEWYRLHIDIITIYSFTAEQTNSHWSQQAWYDKLTSDRQLTSVVL